MINFYKQDGIGKASFADGNIYTPQGNVTLLLDTSTKQILIAEDEHVLFYISTAQELQVNGVEITGTDAEKLALIAPIFNNTSGGGGGGTPSRFGYTGEDVTSDANRSMNMGNFSLVVSGAGTKNIVSAASGHTGGISINADSIQLQSSKDDSTQEAILQIGENGLVLRPDKDTHNAGEVLTLLDEFGAAHFADPYANLQSFATNSEAVAAIGVGKLYKSTTLINGSPIILITV